MIMKLNLFGKPTMMALMLLASSLFITQTGASSKFTTTKVDVAKEVMREKSNEVIYNAIDNMMSGDFNQFKVGGRARVQRTTRQDGRTVVVEGQVVTVTQVEAKQVYVKNKKGQKLKFALPKDNLEPLNLEDFTRVLYIPWKSPLPKDIKKKWQKLQKCPNFLDYIETFVRNRYRQCRNLSPNKLKWKHWSGKASLTVQIAQFVKQMYKDRISETHEDIPKGKWNASKCDQCKGKRKLKTNGSEKECVSCGGKGEKTKDKTWHNYIIGKNNEKKKIQEMKKLIGVREEHAKKIIEAVKKNNERSLLPKDQPQPQPKMEHRRSAPGSNVAWIKKNPSTKSVNDRALKIAPSVVVTKAAQKKAATKRKHNVPSIKSAQRQTTSRHPQVSREPNVKPTRSCARTQNHESEKPRSQKPYDPLRQLGCTQRVKGKSGKTTVMGELSSEAKRLRAERLKKSRSTSWENQS